ncbi:MAG TPA: glycosyltransferase family 4 protein [Gammaproteobacteria bacterium]|nr:glycosyltransferase family 4 protein [Gammaproteobacteria bacterium]
MHLLFVTRKFPPSTGGMEVFSKELYDALSRMDSQTRIYVPSPPIIGRPTMIQLLRFFLGAAVHIIRSRRKIDVLLLGDVLLLPLALISKLFCRHEMKLVGTAHGNDIFFSQGKGLRSRLYRLAIRRLARLPDLLIANSHYTARAASNLGFRNIAVIPLATKKIDLAQSSVPRPVILFAGRLIRYKGLSWFIKEVLPLVSPGLSIEVAGPPWDESEMNAVEQCERVTYLGVVDPGSLAELRASVTACVMPNLPPDEKIQGEGFGLSALEAPAVGVPTVVSRCGGLAEAVVEGVTGFLVEPLDAAAFAARINEIYLWPQAKRQKFSANAKKTVAEVFTWERVGRDYMDLLASKSSRDFAQENA